MSSYQSAHRRRVIARMLGSMALVLPLCAISSGATGSASQQTIRPSDPQSSFGGAVAIDGAFAVVGAADETPQGAAYLFERVGREWSQIARLTPSNPDDYNGPFQNFGASVAIDGSTVVVGSPGELIPPPAGCGCIFPGGAVYTFDVSGPAERHETARLTTSEPRAYGVGSAVAIDGDTIVAASSSGFARQPAFTFSSDGPADRHETGELQPSMSTEPVLRSSVDIEGDTIVMGSGGRDYTGEKQPVYTFSRTGPAVRQETGRLMGSDVANLDLFGYDVAISGDDIVVGSPGHDDDRGALYVFSRHGSTDRSETAKLTASDGGQGDTLGTAVDQEGETIAATADGDAGSGDGQGSVYEFMKSGLSTWSQSAKLIDAEGGRIGSTLGTTADETIVGGAGFAVIFASPAMSARCNGLEPTVVGAGGRIVGTPRADVIVGTDGNDRIFALGGDDVICAGAGNDLVSAGIGANRVLGEGGADILSSGGGGDEILGGSGDDVLSSNGGDDSLSGGAGNDRLNDGSGNDTLTGGSGSDRFGAYSGLDTCTDVDAGDKPGGC